MWDLEVSDVTISCGADLEELLTNLFDGLY